MTYQFELVPPGGSKNLSFTIKPRGPRCVNTRKKFKEQREGEFVMSYIL